MAYLAVALALVIPCWAQQEAPVKLNEVERFRQALQALASAAPDPCNPPSGPSLKSNDAESAVFSRAADAIAEKLNASGPAVSPKDSAAGMLRTLKEISGEVLASWPDEDRFEAKIVDVSPALVLQTSVRGRASYSVVAVATDYMDSKLRRWREVANKDASLDGLWPPTSVSIYPLQRGPSGRARFLAEFEYLGCAGNTFGITYDGREWDSTGTGNLEQIIKQSGSFGLDQVPAKPTAKNPFPGIGELQTKGAIVSLPYCWFSAIDTWDNPSMCAVDTYDLSGDNVKFRSRSYNRPDLLPIAKAIEYAEQHDYPAVLAYCGSNAVARKLVREIPTFVFADAEVKVTNIGHDRKRVEFGDGNYRFEVERRGGRWIVIAFK